MTSGAPLLCQRGSRPAGQRAAAGQINAVIKYPLNEAHHSRGWKHSKHWNPLGMSRESMSCEMNCRVHQVNTEDGIKQPGLQRQSTQPERCARVGFCLSPSVCVNLIFLTITSLRRESWCILQCRGREGEGSFFRGERLPQIEESLWMQSSRGCVGNYTAMGCDFSSRTLENLSLFFFSALALSAQQQALLLRHSALQQPGFH